MFLSKFLNAEELSFVINYSFDNIYYLFLHPVLIKVFIVKSLWIIMDRAMLMKNGIKWWIDSCMFFLSHKTFFMPHTKSNTQLWMKKGNFVHKAPELKQLNTWCSRFICLQFPALTFALDLGGTTQILSLIHISEPTRRA